MSELIWRKLTAVRISAGRRVYVHVYVPGNNEAFEHKNHHHSRKGEEWDVNIYFSRLDSFVQLSQP